MIDIHSHILPGIDDGSNNLEQSIEILREARDAGFSKIILTPHYIEDYYNVDEESRNKLMDELKENYQEIELYLGNEIYISENMIDLIKEKKASSLNGSRYILFEFPMNNKAMIAKEMIYRIIENNYIPIVAHPERYSYVQENPEYVKELAEMGALFQSNYGSIVGLYGNKAKKTLKKLLKEDLISFFGSDAHRTEQVYYNMHKIIKKLRKVISDEKLEELTEINPQKIIDNEPIE